MTGCSRCGSAAINPFSHGRDPAEDLHLCDVCYWRERAEEDPGEIDQLTDALADARRDADNYQVDYEAAQEKIDDLKEEISDLRTEHSGETADLEATIANLKRENKRLEDELLGPQS